MVQRAITIAGLKPVSRKDKLRKSPNLSEGILGLAELRGARPSEGQKSVRHPLGDRRGGREGNRLDTPGPVAKPIPVLLVLAAVLEKLEFCWEVAAGNIC